MNSSEVDNFDCINKEIARRKSNKRRSSIYTIRENLKDINECPLSDSEHIKTDNLTQKKESEQSFNLAAYNKSLKDEIASWKAMYKQRKARTRYLLKEKERLETEGQSFSLDILSKTDRNFLINVPNYKQFLEDTNKLLEVTIQTIFLNQQIKQSDEKLISILDEGVKDATQQIIQMID